MTLPPAGLPPFSPTPVFIRKADVVVSWSPKSGCSHVVFWAFGHEGCRDQAAQGHHLPHGYRIHTYQKQPDIVRRLRRLRAGEAEGLTLVRVTRDPKKRLVSIFRHACKHPFLHAAVREKLGFDPAVEGFALTDLDALLGHLKLDWPTDADPHVRAQASPLWELPFRRTITINMDEIPLDPSLHAVERALGLPETDFGLPAFRNLREAHYARPRGFPKGVPVATHRFRPAETRGFPKSVLMASPFLAEMARRHYAADYAAGLASGDTAGELFQAAPAAEAAAAVSEAAGTASSGVRVAT